MKFLIFSAAGIVVLIIIVKIMRIVIEDIRDDPVSNLIIPAATAILANVLLRLL